ncbi:hypothetical protein [Acidaminococcus sp.]|uniref:hypothetical protein n=1 Tax=Acidaminococcus sp. TaxID=1872103 RepID=UPI003D7D3846
MQMFLAFLDVLFRGFEWVKQVTRIPWIAQYLLLMVAACLCGSSLRRRIFQQGVRRAVMWGTLVWELWLFIRLGKLLVPYTFWEELYRLLWYAYYPCMGSLTFLVVWMGYASNRPPEDRKIPRWLQALGLLDLLVTVLVLTNDWHQEVFQIVRRQGMAPDRIYTYGAVYYGILGLYLFQLLLALGWLGWKVWQERLWRLRCLVPALVTLLYLGYIAGYILRIPLFYHSELVLWTFLVCHVWLEALLWARLLPGNRDYESCFTHSRLGLTILDGRNRPVYQCQPFPHRQEENWQRRTMPITGGQVVWYQAMGELRRKQKKLEETNRLLQRMIQLQKNWEKLRREQIRQQVQFQIYQEVETILQSKGPVIQRYARFLETAREGEETWQAMARLNVLACYLKKQCVLLLRGREDNQVPARELQLAIGELCHYLERVGLKSLVDVRLEGTLPVDAALEFFQFLETASEEAVRRGLDSQVCSLKPKGSGWELTLLWENQPWIPSFADGIQHQFRGILGRKELGYGQCLALRWEGGRRK